MSLDFSTDHLILDGKASVSLRKASGGDATPIESVKRMAVSLREAMTSGGRYTTRDSKFRIAIAETAIVPAVGDVILEASGAEWEILDVDTILMGSAYRCWSRRLSIELPDVVEVQVGVPFQSELGTTAYRWDPAWTALAAAVHELSAEERREPTGRRLQRTHVVYLEKDLPIDARHRIVHGQDVYRVVGLSDRSQPGKLMALNVSYEGKL